jgi:hypothetical protein
MSHNNDAFAISFPGPREFSGLLVFVQLALPGHGSFRAIFVKFCSQALKQGAKNTGSSRIFHVCYEAHVAEACHSFLQGLQSLDKGINLNMEIQKYTPEIRKYYSKMF